ncbi:er lumen protein retaining receptor [Zymoseptoria brevis]|uniref:Er lumen protein retaining receptor n=1 Tax=Zymoseptoria brevis TaxID=1047168 RepID=A0A0F4GH20_9PEZI|nr:er lumen protein retaining receptor [Zymoseptoria brevis]
MAEPMSIFRILGDVSHSASKCILIWSIHSNKSAEGVSLLTQLLYALVFCTRYLDILWVPPTWSLWNFVLKILYIATSLYTIFLMMRVHARTREKEYGWKLAIWSLAGSVISAPLVSLLFNGWKRSTLFEIFWTFSIILESVCVLPQLLLLRQTTVPTVIDSFYLVTLGAYRFFYIPNWIVRYASTGKFDPISFIFGLIQTALYIDFAWVYWSRQRVKLRNGGVVDSDDLSKSFIVKRFIGRRGNRNSADEDDGGGVADPSVEALSRQENGTVRPTPGRSGRSWGARGISVSADQPEDDYNDGAAADAQMVDPSHFEDGSDDDVDAPPPPAKDDPNKNPAAPKKDIDEEDDDDPFESSATEWQDGGSK